MEVDEIEVIELELKYCERCGGLWLRRRGTEEVYCPPCVPKMLQCAIRGPRKGRLRLPVSDDIEIHGRCEELTAGCGIGGHA
ncbi:MAG: zf-TFIIB domain-containing protein [Acidobacteriia bacterium]|nr:zf-TFIIB domain-containing protein [Terriglobia bacterium]